MDLKDFCVYCITLSRLNSGKKVQEHIRLMNRWYKGPHWDYDRRKLCFIEISDSKENDGDGIEEPRPGSVIRTID